MREKVKDLVYLDTERYMSLDSLRIFYWAIIIIPLIIAVLGFAAINKMGICLVSLFPLVSIVVWSLFYWIFVLKIQSKKTKKTFELRFLVNGISGLLLSSLFWIFYTSFNLVTDNPIFEFDFSLWILFFYILFSVTYIGLIVIGIHKGVYKKIHKKSHTPKAIAIDALLASILPIAGVSGMLTSKLLRAYASVSIQNIVATISFVLLIFIPALAHINFVQFYYCKKYGIDCDEDGNTTSPALERKPKEKKRLKKVKKTLHDKKKRIPLFIKILIGILCVPVAFFVILFIIGFIKAIIENI